MLGFAFSPTSNVMWRPSTYALCYTWYLVPGKTSLLGHQADLYRSCTSRYIRTYSSKTNLTCTRQVGTWYCIRSRLLIGQYRCFGVFQCSAHITSQHNAHRQCSFTLSPLDTPGPAFLFRPPVWLRSVLHSVSVNILSGALSTSCSALTPFVSF